MSSNSCNIKGLNLGSSPKKPAFLCQSIFKSNIAERESSSRAKYKLRQRCLQIFLIVFYSVLSNNLMAQMGNSCSNPYVMNLNAGAISNQINIPSSDSIFFISLTGFYNKINLKFNLDTSNHQCYIGKWQVNSNNCNNPINVANRIYHARFDEIKGVLDLIGYDTAIVVINKATLIGASNSTNELICTISLSNIIGGTTNPCLPQECNNLLQNASFEEFTPPTMNFSQISQLGAFMDTYVCGWSDVQDNSAYFDDWFSDPAGCLNQASPPSVCNSMQLSYYGGTCDYPLQTNNPYFTSNDSYSGLVFGDNGASAPLTGSYYNSGVMRGRLIPALVQNRKYYVEANIAKPPRQSFGGQIDFDLSANPIFNQGNYPNGTQITLSSPAIDYDPALGWTKLNTIFESTNGGEEYLYIGNLTLFPVMHDPCTPNNMCGNQMGAAAFYIFDNLVVKEFFADAGDANITVCPGSEIGGVSCKFPNGTYEWLPANLFADNALYNPTFIGTTNATVSLTVSIIMADGTTQVSDISYVNITIGPTVSITGATGIISGNNTTLNALGASTYTWYDNVGNIVGTGTSFITPNLTQTTTYTVVGVDANGCSAEATVTVVVTTLPQACISDPNFPNAILIPDGTDFSGLISLIPPLSVQTSGNNEYHIDTVNFALEGKLYIDNNALVYFNNCHFACYDGAQIINTANLTFRVCTLEACNNVLWKGISNEGKLAISSSEVRDALDGVLIAPQTINEISGTIFTNNYRGLNIFGPCTFANSRNTFENPDPLYPHWLGSNLSKALCGINISDATFVQIDGSPTSNQLFTTFRNINCGILCQNTDLLVSNAYFENIADQFGVANNINGTAIYTQGTAAHRLRVFPLNGVNQATTFLNCATGIYHEGYNTRLDYLGMQNVTRGIVGEQLAFCTNRMEYNNINATIYGVEMNLIDDVDLFVINHNTITMNSTIARGIAVSAFSNSSSAGSNIKIQGNTIDITRGSVGIEVNSINHPKVNINVISHGLVSTSGFATTWHGVKATNCFRADISCNNLTVGAGLIPGNSGADIYVAQSQSTLLACNTTNGESPTGIFLSSGNNGSAIQTNEIGSHSIGLYLDNSCVIGPQPSPSGQPHGNRWNGVYGNANYNGAGAVNESVTIINQVIDPFSLQANRFKVNDSPGNYPFWPENYPDNIYGNQSDPNSNNNWFQLDALNPTFDICTGGYCPAPFEDHWDDDKKEMGSSINGVIALGLIQTAGYPEETKWMLKKGLITSLSSSDSLLNANDTMQVFYYGIDQENLKKLQLIADTMMSVKLINQVFISVMNSNDSIMNELSIAMLNLMPLLEDSILHDSIAFIIETLYNQYSIIADVNETISMQLNNQRNTAGQQSLNINTGIVPNNFNEYIERQVNDIYLRTYGQDLDTLTVSDIATLSYICHICPQAGGPSIYKARALYQMVNDTVVYNDSIVCRNVGYFRESQELLMPSLKENVKSNSFVIFPNPAQESLTMMITGNTEDGFVSIYNAMGVLVESIKIAKESNNKELNISTWAEGYYLIKYQTNNYQSQIKFIKIK